MLSHKRSIITRPKLQRIEWQDLCGGQCSSADEISSISFPHLCFSSSWKQMKPRQIAWTRSLSEKKQVEAEQPGVLKHGVFHARRLESRSIAHRYMSNHRELSSSNVIQPHAMCVGYIRPQLTDQELDKTRR